MKRKGPLIGVEQACTWYADKRVWEKFGVRPPYKVRTQKYWNIKYQEAKSFLNTVELVT
jgi:hypothetical protein